MFDCQFPNLSGFATSTNGKLMEIHKSSLYIIGNEKAGYCFSSFCFYASGARQRFRFRLSACYFAGRLCRPDDCSRWSGLLHDPFGVQLCPGIPRLAFARPAVLGACLPCARLGYAPDLIKYDGKFYIYYPAHGTNYVTWATDIRGPWSKPIDLKVGGIDPGHVVDSLGNRYLHLSGGTMVELSRDGLSAAGKRHKVYEGWQYPEDWEVECFCLESPKLTFHNGYFYMTSAEGGTAGPATSHMAVSARSRSAVGPWENSPYNPVVHTYSASDQWWSKGHATIIDDVNGNWWIVYHAYPNGLHTLGRSTLIEPIEWTADGWFRTKPSAKPISRNPPVVFSTPSDTFDGNTLGLLWSGWRRLGSSDAVVSGGKLSLQSKGSGIADGRVLVTTPTDARYDVRVDALADGWSGAGLTLFYNEKAFIGIVATADSIAYWTSSDVRHAVPNGFGRAMTLRIVNDSNRCSLQTSPEGKSWRVLADGIDVSAMNHNELRGFLALRVGLVATGQGAARFDNFSYAKLGR